MHGSVLSWGGLPPTPAPEGLQRLTLRGAPSLRLCPEGSHCGASLDVQIPLFDALWFPALLRLSFPEVQPGAPSGELVPFRTHFNHFLYLGHDCPSFPDV